MVLILGFKTIIAVFSENVLQSEQKNRTERFAIE